MRREGVATIKMKRVEEGGREFPFYAGFCPHLRVEGIGPWLPIRVVQVVMSRDSNYVHPGETARVKIEFMGHAPPEAVLPPPGIRFVLHEGPKIIATGTMDT